MNLKTSIPLIPSLRFPEFDGRWQEKQFGEIAQFSKGKGISKIDIAENGNTDCIRYGELYTHYHEVIRETYSKTNIDVKHLVLSEANDVIIPASGESATDIATAACVLKPNIALGGDLNIIKTLHNGVFIAYYLNHQKKASIAALAQGASVVHLYARQLALLRLNLPSFAEQQKIAAFLSALDDKIHALQKQQTLLQRYKKGVMQQIFAQQWRFKAVDGTDFPDWAVKPLGEISKITTGSSNREDSNLDGEFTFFDRSQDIRSSNHFLFDAEAVIVPGEGQEFIPKYFIGKFDLHQRTYAIMDFKNHSGKFLYYSISHHSKHLIVQAVGTTVKSLRLPMFTNMPIALPCLEEQKKIANFLSAIDDKIHVCTRQLAQTTAYKKGILQQMFL
jgi:type I restriction enzyme, S subunit